VFTSLEIAGYHVLRKKCGAKVTDISAIFTVFTTFCALQLVYGAKSYNWLALYVFSGILCGKLLCGKTILTKWSQKLVAMSLWTGIMVLVNFFNNITGMQMNRTYCIRQIKYFLFAFAIYLSIHLAAIIIKSARQEFPEEQEQG
jgi:hypothetical protein